MGSLFSRASGGSAGAEGGAELASEVQALACLACTPGTPRAVAVLAPQRARSDPHLCLAIHLRAYRRSSLAYHASEMTPDGL